ncbi:hypothetical protein [Kocuria sp.]|uniref:hypothetical protein n=1 Tax=Kocuria sp. TaxID=1871328 RepID=UPI0026E07EEE|nr:hypothetical protein [Kocuria sp.]MDO5619768.1 hypothetical protein [Kocuria sp.]
MSNQNPPSQGPQQHDPQQNDPQLQDSQYQGPQYQAPKYQGPQDSGYQHAGQSQSSGTSGNSGSSGTYGATPYGTGSTTPNGPSPATPSYNGAPQYARPPQYQRPGDQQPQYMPASGPGVGSPYSPPPAPAKGKPPLWVGIVITCLAPLVAVVGIILAFVIGQSQLTQEIADAQPGISHELTGGTVHTLMAPQSDAVLASDCSIYNPDYDSVPITTGYGTTETRPDGEVYAEVGEFTTDQDGTYRILCSTSMDTVALEGNGYLSIGLGSLAAVLIAGLIGVVGIALIIVNRVTASRARRATMQQASYPHY